ncbi:metal ABC transporter solute-binding protein, Zn/Mn family [Acetilactobacillus jinshanensis]|nr:zinc ABC transporter substrate-binding protein [Acetilactobacillus jinshanensis]
MKLFKKLGCSLLLVMTALLFLSGCSTERPSRANGINVVSSVNFYGTTAKAVLGHYGHVTSLIKNSSIDPHDFTPTVRDAERVSQADFVISNGLNYDNWMNSLSQDAPHAKRIKVGQTLLHQPLKSNPHVWYRLNTMPELANYLAKQFSKKDPAHRKFFYRNAHHYDHSLAILKTQINWLKHHRQKSRVDVSEPVFDYELREIGYQINDPSYAKAVEHGTDPSPEAIRSVQNDIKHRRIAFFVENTQASDAIVNNLVKLAHRHHVPVMKITETMPNGMNYRSWMMKQNYRLEMIQAREKESN